MITQARLGFFSGLAKKGGTLLKSIEGALVRSSFWWFYKGFLRTLGFINSTLPYDESWHESRRT
jgi:hypothetical protein